MEKTGLCIKGLLEMKKIFIYFGLKFRMNYIKSSLVFLALTVMLAACKKDKIPVSHPPVTVSLQPANNPDEAEVANNAPTSPFKNPPELAIQAWTESGDLFITRVFIKFDLSEVPTNAVISDARLSLYSIAVPLNGDFVNAQSGSANAYIIKRVTSPWDATTLTWNNQPVSSMDSAVFVPQSTSASQDAADIDVSGIVKDMLVNGNNGFSLALQNETIYNIRQYVSSSDTSVLKRPKLTITYQVR